MVLGHSVRSKLTGEAKQMKEDTRTVAMVVGSLFVLLAVFIIILLLQARDANIPLEVAKGLINLAVALLITGALSFFVTKFLADRAREQAQLDERVRVLTTALQDFKGGYEQASITRFFLSASPSAKSLEERMTGLAEARARLQRVQRERFLRENKPINGTIQRMLNYLSSLGNEYRQHYSLIAMEALAEEATRQKALKDCTTNVEIKPVLPDSRFPCFSAFLSEDEWDNSTFKESYRKVKTWLEAELDNTVSKSFKS
jgi:hypothetical protein